MALEPHERAARAAQLRPAVSIRTSPLRSRGNWRLLPGFGQGAGRPTELRRPRKDAWIGTVPAGNSRRVHARTLHGVHSEREASASLPDLASAVAASGG